MSCRTQRRPALRAPGFLGLGPKTCMRSCSAVLSLLRHVQAPRLLPRGLAVEPAAAPAGWLRAEAAAAPAAAGRHRLQTAAPRSPAAAVEAFGPAGDASGSVYGVLSPRLEQYLTAVFFGPAGGGGGGPRRAASPDLALGEHLLSPAAAGAAGPQLADADFGAVAAASAPAPAARHRRAHPSQGVGLGWPLEWPEYARRARQGSGAHGATPAISSPPPLAAPALPGLTGELASPPAPAAAGGSGAQLGDVCRGLSAEISDSELEAVFAPKPAAAGGSAPLSQDAGGPPLVRPAGTPLRASVVQLASAWRSRLHGSKSLCVGTALHSAVCMSLHGHCVTC